MSIPQKSKRKVLSLLTGLTANLLLASVCLAAGEYQTAFDLYNKKQYPQAAQYFEMASISDPSNVSANYYAGYSFYLAGRKNEAIKSFWRLVRAFPSRKEGLQARELLKRLDPDYAKNASGPAQASAFASATTGHKSEADSASMAKLSDTGPKLSARTVVDALVQVKPSTGKLANVSPVFVEKIKELLVAMPMPVLMLLKNSGGSILISPSVVEHDMRIQNTTPRGWSEDFDWKSSPALTHGSQVVVSQNRLDTRTGEYVDTTPEIGVVRHETGHAIDYCMHRYTESADFKHAYFLDAAQVPEEFQKRLDYYLQKHHPVLLKHLLSYFATKWVERPIPIAKRPASWCINIFL